MPDCDSALSLRPYSSVYFIGNSFFKGLLHIILHKVMENMNKTELLSTVFRKPFGDGTARIQYIALLSLQILPLFGEMRCLTPHIFTPSNLSLFEM